MCSSISSSFCIISKWLYACWICKSISARTSSLSTSSSSRSSDISNCCVRSLIFCSDSFCRLYLAIFCSRSSFSGAPFGFAMTSSTSRLSRLERAPCSSHSVKNSIKWCLALFRFSILLSMSVTCMQREPR
eukprot:Lithocolla_globosa_v1_NODE_2813_length_1860_cov_31.424377.p3 type:complete len:131 gc:universal NODE_2813_length_1860_cov_31.424377:1162-1554(+)